jgi:hypothetical protein
LRFSLLNPVPSFGVSLVNPSPLLCALLCCFDTVDSSLGGLLLSAQCKRFPLLDAQLCCGFALLCFLGAACLPSGSLLLPSQCKRFLLLGALFGCLGALSFFSFAARFLL